MSAICGHKNVKKQKYYLIIRIKFNYDSSSKQLVQMVHILKF